MELVDYLKPYKNFGLAQPLGYCPWGTFILFVWILFDILLKQRQLLIKLFVVQLP